MRRAVTLALIAAFVLLGLTAVSGEPVKLQYKFSKGNIDRYKLQMVVSLPNLFQSSQTQDPLTMSAVIAQKVLDVRPDGTAKVLISFSNLKVSSTLPNSHYGQQNMRIPPVTALVKRDGSVQILQGAEGFGQAFQMPGMDYGQITGQMGMLPAWPVEVGDGWQQDIPVPFGGGKMTVTSRVVSTGPSDGIDASKIRQNFDTKINLGEFMKSFASGMSGQGRPVPQMPEISGSMDLTGTAVMYFSQKKGRLVSARQDMTANIKMGVPAQSMQPGSSKPSMEFSLTMGLKLTLTRL
jgi:hypothetical protein